VHRLLHKFSGTEDAASLLAALNDDLAHHGNSANQAARLTTVVVATMDHLSGEFNFAYAAHPRMLHWRAREARWQPLGQNLDGMLLGFIAGEAYNQQSVRLEPADIVLAFSDGVTEVESPQGEHLSAEGFLGLVRTTLGDSPQSLSLYEIAEQLLEALSSFHGSREFHDDLTLLTLRRPK
jgi:sigma-B regulation protein RsbU (phosphoserine phosphatase)